MINVRSIDGKQRGNEPETYYTEDKSISEAATNQKAKKVKLFVLTY
jgi:hypothetical protein